MTSYNSYDSHGNPLDITSHIRTITYDTAGNPITTVDAPAYRHLTYTYGSYNRPTSITDVIAATTTTIDYVEPGDGTEVVTITAPKINASDTEAPQTVIVYRADGQIDSITDPLNRLVDYTYDGSGTLTRITDPNNIVSSFSNFDDLGLAETLTLTGNDGSTTRTTSLDYDALARLIQITQGATTPLITAFDYDGLGNRTSVIDAEDRETTFEHDSKGQVTKISNTLKPGETEERIIDTLLHYGGSGCPSCSGSTDKLTALTDAKTQTTFFGYDQLGRLTKEIDAENNVLSTTYYADGRPKQQFEGEVDSGTLLLSYEYTSDGKLEFKKDGAGNTLASYSYNNKQQLETASTPDSSYTLTYYDNSWLKSIDNGTYVVEYTYDALGRRELVTISQGGTTLHSIDYVYDPTTKELTDIVSDQAGTFSFGTDPFGRRQALSYPNGIVGSYSYDDTNQLDWLTGITYTDSTTSSNILNIGYPEHDKVGNRTQRAEDGTVTSYSYDDLYRVTTAQTGPSVENFTYDDVGNRESGPTVKDTPEVSYDHNSANQMTKGRKYTYQYDNRGNQIYRIMNSTGTKYWYYSWNASNQLTQADLVFDGTTIRTVSFKYDAFGRRIEKRIEGLAPAVPVPLTTTYLYDGEDIILELISDGTTTTTRQYLHGPGIDEPLAQVVDGQSYFYHADGLGSILALTDSGKGIVQRYSYDTFGMLTSIQNPEFGNAYTYTAREWDRELGLYYYRARYYDPMEGRFISKDPIGFAGGDVNLYGYVVNNPIMYIDPYGTSPLDCGMYFYYYYKCATKGLECKEEECRKIDDEDYEDIVVNDSYLWNKCVEETPECKKILESGAKCSMTMPKKGSLKEIITILRGKDPHPWLVE